MKTKKFIFLPLCVFPIAFILISYLEAQNQSAPSENPGETITVTYKVPATFLSLSGNKSSGGAGAADPFADPADSGGGAQTRKNPRAVLEESGITMEPGASVIYDAKAGTLTVRNTRNQHELVQAYLDSIQEAGEKQIQVIVEFIEVEHFDFSNWLLSNHFDNNATPLRKIAQEWIREGNADIVETATILARSGQRAKAESISEYIYPTEFDPPIVPKDVTLGSGTNAPIGDFTPTAFETRNLGTTIEVDPVLGADGHTIDLNLSPEIVELEGNTSWSNDDYKGGVKLEQPLFHAMKVTTQLTLHSGTYQMIGTTRPLNPTDPKRKNPIILVFVRADVSSLNKWSVEPAK